MIKSLGGRSAQAIIVVQASQDRRRDNTVRWWHLMPAGAVARASVNPGPISVSRSAWRESGPTESDTSGACLQSGATPPSALSHGAQGRGPCQWAPDGCGARFLLRSPWAVLILLPLFLLFLFLHLLLLAFFLVFLATFVSHACSFFATMTRDSE